MKKRPNLSFEKSLWEKGLKHIAGLDEAGRGAWAGPVAAAAVILPLNLSQSRHLPGVRDSKQMTARQRVQWAEKIKSAAIAWGVGMASNLEIDALGIVPSTRLAMRRALAELPLSAQHLLIDALKLPKLPLPQTVLIKGDQRSLSIAAASILAKTTRDAFMVQSSEIHCGYGFERHKGYGTRIHQAALQQIGPCPIHRFSFAPLKRLGTDQQNL